MGCCLGMLMGRFSTAACQRETIRVGFSGTLTGPYSDLGIHGRNGARLAVEDINTAGGIHGHPIELIVIDDDGTPAGAIQAVYELADRGVVAIIGHMVSSLSMAALPAAEEKQLPLISPTTSTPLLRGRKDLFFRVQLTTDAAARALGRWVTGKPPVRTLATVRDLRNNTYSEPWEAAFVKEFESLGGNVCCRLVYKNLDPSVLVDFATQVKTWRPDAILLISSAQDAALFLRAMNEHQIHSLCISSGWAQTEAFLVEAGLSAQKVLFAADNVPADSSPTLREFSWRYRQRFGVVPSFAAVRAYEAVRFLGMALHDAGGRREDLVKALSRPRRWDGLYGTIHIDEFGDTSGPYFIVTVRDGRFVVLEWMAGEHQ